MGITVNRLAGQRRNAGVGEAQILVTGTDSSLRLEYVADSVPSAIRDQRTRHFRSTA